MSKQNKFVVVDWGSWGIEVQSSSKIIVADPNVKEGDDCSLQGTDPATKRPMLFHGQILAVFGKFIPKLCPSCLFFVSDHILCEQVVLDVSVHLFYDILLLCWIDIFVMNR